MLARFVINDELPSVIMTHSRLRYKIAATQREVSEM
jgi:hypothetical protein